MSSGFQSTFKLKAWQKAHELTLFTYKATDSFPAKENTVLTSQIRRAAISVPSNIFEGMARRGLKDQIRFLIIARSSLSELQYQSYLATDIGYISDKDFNHITALIDVTGKLLNGLIASIDRKVKN